jgi:hypothetical protein
LAVPDESKRFRCHLPLLNGVIVGTCGCCSWTHHIEADDASAGQVAFDGHHCKDFPLPEILSDATLGHYQLL